MNVILNGILVTYIHTPTGDCFTTTTMSGERGCACRRAVLCFLTAHGCSLCLSGYSNTQLKHIQTEQGQCADSLVDGSHHAGALETFDISCCGTQIICLSYCAILLNVFPQCFLYIDTVGRLNQMYKISRYVSFCMRLTFCVMLQCFNNRILIPIHQTPFPLYLLSF